MQPKQILILGAGGNSLAIADAILAINAGSPARPVYELVGFLDDLPENQGRHVLGREGAPGREVVPYPFQGGRREAGRFFQPEKPNDVPRTAPALAL